MDPRLKDPMAPKKKSAKTFEGMTYREVQRSNSQQRSQLSKEQQQQIKQAGFRNVGWPNVIALYQQLEKLVTELPALEDLFLEADRIGNKYQTIEEKASFQKKMATISMEMSELIDQQFPDKEVEIVSFKGKKRH